MELLITYSADGDWVQVWNSVTNDLLYDGHSVPDHVWLEDVFNVDYEVKYFKGDNGQPTTFEQALNCSDNELEAKLVE